MSQMRAERGWRDRTERALPTRWAALERPHHVVQSFETFAQTCWELYETLPPALVVGPSLSYEQFRRQVESAFNPTESGPYPYLPALVAIAINLTNKQRASRTDRDMDDQVKDCMDMARITRILQFWAGQGGQYLLSASTYLQLLGYVRASLADRGRGN